MRIHLAWIRVAATAAITVAGVQVNQVAAQYPAYRPAPQVAPNYGYPTAQQPQYGPAQQPAYQAYRPQAPQSVAPYAGAPQQHPQSAGRYSSPPPQYRPYPTYPSVAQTPTPAEESLPAPASATMNPPLNGGTAEGYPVNGHQGYPNGGAPSHGYHGDAHSSYPATSGYAGYNNCGQADYGVSQYFDTPGCETQWFGGVYLLYMERNNPGYTRFASQVDTPASYPYYPPARTTVLSSEDIDHDFREGVEVRFGSTFTIGSACETDCYGGYGGGCGGCAPDTYAWEFVYWGIADDEQRATVIDLMPTVSPRLYGMVNHAGLEYDSGGGYRPVNDYYDYQMPIEDDMPAVDGDVRVLAQRARTNFRAQNLELNFLRFPVMGYSAPVAASGCDAYGGQGYSDCGYAGDGCDTAACAPAPSFSLAGLCGIRYFRTDDDIELATEYGTYAGGAIPQMYDGFSYMATNEIFHDIQVENHLMGFQLGANMNYCVGSKWNLFWDTNFGLYNNHITHYQRVYAGGGGPIRFEESDGTATVRSTKDTIAFLGEMRLGGAYDISCNWRAVLAYRAVALSGVALSTEQIRPEYSNYADVARIDASGSMIVHGIQAGVECRY